MNSLQLIQSAARKWLTVPDQSSMDLGAMQDLLDSLNLTQAEIWRMLPGHYKRQPVSVAFYAPTHGNITVTGGYGTRAISGVVFPEIQDVLAYEGEPLLYEGEPLIFNGGSVFENPRYYCSILVDGDANINTFNGTNLIHPYMGESTESVGALLYHDSTLSPVNIERIISPVVDHLNGNSVWAVNSFGWKGQNWGRNFTMRRVSHAGTSRTVISLNRQHDAAVVLSFDAIIAPTGLTLGSSMRPADLPYDDEVAAMIIAAAGVQLRTHPKFNPELLNATADAALTTYRQIDRFSVSISGQPNAIGTPRGW